MTTRSVQPEQTQRCGIWLIFIFLTSVVRFFFSWNWLVTKWLFHFDEFFDKTKLWARFQQETCRDALIALWQHVFTRKIILIFSALIGLRAPSKTNNLKGWLNPPLPSYIKETYLWKCVMLLLSDWQFEEKNCATNRSSSLIFPFPMWSIRARARKDK